MATSRALTALFAFGLLVGCAAETRPLSETFGPNPNLPPPQTQTIPRVNIAKATGWPEGATPTAAPGLSVKPFATGLDHPRWMLVLPNGDVLVAETDAPPKPDDSKGLRGFFMKIVMRNAGSGKGSANRIILLRDADGDGAAETRSVLLEGLNSPFGMALAGDRLYVANTDAIVSFPYRPGETRIDAPAQTLTTLPAGRINHHWTKNIVATPEGDALYVAVGSNSNVMEKGAAAEEGRAGIWRVELATGAMRPFATGLRNPVGMAIEPNTRTLWTAVNERDEIGDNLVPDYITSVREGGFYGWPYSYYGQTVDVRAKPARPDLVSVAIKPDYAVGAHTASLGLAFAAGAQLGPRFQSGAFIGQHGSWNRKPRSGYAVIFVPFENGRPKGGPDGGPTPVLTGFLQGNEALGRPVGVAIAKDGALLVADDVGNAIWRVSEAGVAAAGDPTARFNNLKP